MALRTTMGSGEQTPYTGAIAELPRQRAVSVDQARMRP
jgi:hypothetical protein